MEIYGQRKLKEATACWQRNAAILQPMALDLVINEAEDAL